MTDLQVLNKVVEDTEAFRVLTVLDVNKGADFGRLKNGVDKCLRLDIEDHITHLKSNVITTNTDFELLLADNVFLRPIRIVFPTRLSER